MLIPHVNEFSEDEVKAAWYSREEYEMLKKDCQRTAKLVKQATLVGCQAITPSICGRGLECIVDRNRSNLRSNRRVTAWDMILDEQYKQRKDYTCDSQAIADLYRTVSEQAQSDAYQVGLKDQQAVLSDSQERGDKSSGVNKGLSSRWMVSSTRSAGNLMLLTQTRKTPSIRNLQKFGVLSRTP